MAFPPEFLDEIRARVPLADVIGRRVRLQKRGREHSGLCPFHNEKTPSFTVSEDKGFYHCFGCGAHGDVIGFVMRSEGLPFPEAIEKLAGEAGLAVPRSAPEDRAAERQRADLLEVLEEAAGWFEAQLAAGGGGEARAYLERRGLSETTIGAFRLGFAPDRRGALRQALNAKGMTDDLLAQAGLIKLPEAAEGTPNSESSEAAGGRQPREYFFNRIIFPITDRRGRVIAFGGRALGESKAKYLNSPDGALFHKGRVLYNLARAREAARSGGELLVTEGYMDVIALAQAGFQAAVAPLGTAITEPQIAELWRLVKEPVLCLDGDAAGRRAAFRAIERALPQLQPGRSLRFALLPEGEDPDSLLRQRGAPALRREVERAQPLAAMLWAWHGQGGRFDTPERRTALWKALAGALDQIGDADLRDAYRMDMAERFAAAFGYAPGRAGGGRAWARPRRGARQRGFSGQGPVSETLHGAAARVARRSPDGLRHRQEQVLLATLINHPALLAERAEDFATLELESADLRRLSMALLDLAAQAPDLDTTALKCHLTELGYSKVLDGLSGRPVYDLGPCARPETPLAAARSGWGHVAALLRQRHAVAETLEAGRRLAEDMSEENLVRLQAKQRVSDSDGSREMDSDGFGGPESHESD